MSTVVQTIIYLILMFGIIMSVAALCDIFRKENLEMLRNVRVKSIKNDNVSNSIYIHIYAKNDEDVSKVLQVVLEDDKLNSIANRINVYKTFDK